MREGERVLQQLMSAPNMRLQADGGFAGAGPRGEAAELASGKGVLPVTPPPLKSEPAVRVDTRRSLRRCR